jgi:SAM-dependent methyltransferase
MSVIWHDLECGAYVADLPLWRRLAEEHGGPVLDIGAGTGRVALELARAGHRVSALDADPVLIAELARRATDLPVDTAVADAREFRLGRRFPLCVVPMQTVQLLGGREGREAFFRCARAHLEQDGVLAAAISDELELYEADRGLPTPLPDMREIDGVVYSSQPTAVREEDDGFVLERRRETIGTAGQRSVDHDSIRLDRVTGGQLESEARAVGLRPAGRTVVEATNDHVGSVVVMLRA